MTEKTLHTEKAKLWRQYTKLVWEGKQLTYYWGVGVVNMADNERFLNELENIGRNNYIKDINEYQFIRKNKQADQMTIAQIKELIFNTEKVVSVYRNMSDSNRKTLAICTMINHYQKFIIDYEFRIETKKEYYLLEGIKNMKNKIIELEGLLVA